MNQMLLPIILAGVIAMSAWALWAFFSNPQRMNKRRLTQRLSAENVADPLANVSRSIVVENDEERLPEALAKIPLFRTLSKRLHQAWPTMPVGRFLLIVTAAALIPPIVAYAFTGPIIAVAVMAAGAYIPFFMMNSRRNKRQRALAMQLPEALDFLSRVLRAGHSLTTGLQMMGEELPAPLADEFRRCYDQHSLGQSLDSALKEMTTRVQSTDFAFFVTATLIQRQTGGDLSGVLGNIGQMIRGRMRLANQVKAKTAEGRFTGYILVAFPAIMFLLVTFLQPSYGDKMLKQSSGLMMLGTAFGLQMLGLFTIRKITNVKV